MERIMTLPLVYIAISPELVQELYLDEQFGRLDHRAQVERWPGSGAPTPEVVSDALRRAQVVFTGWKTPALTALAEWTPQDFAVRLVAHTAGTVKHLLPVQA